MSTMSNNIESNKHEFAILEIQDGPVVYFSRAPGEIPRVFVRTVRAGPYELGPEAVASSEEITGPGGRALTRVVLRVRRDGKLAEHVGWEGPRDKGPANSTSSELDRACGLGRMEGRACFPELTAPVSVVLEYAGEDGQGGVGYEYAGGRNEAAVVLLGR